MESRGISPVWVIVGIAVFALILCSIAVYQAYFAPKPGPAPVTYFTTVRMSALNEITREVVPGIKVELVGPMTITKTDTDLDGTVEFDYVPSGTYTITVSRDNYYTTRATKELKGTEPVLVLSPFSLKPAAVGADFTTTTGWAVSSENSTSGPSITVGLPEKTILVGPVLDLKVNAESVLKVLSISVVSGGTLTKVEENHWTIALGPEIRENVTVSLSIKVDSQGKDVGNNLVFDITLRDTPVLPERDNNLIPDVTKTAELVRVVA
jgi:hypothetical protein